MLLNLLVGFVSALATQTILISTVAGGGAFLEFGLLLVIGSCLMSKQPIENRDRYTPDGGHTTSWRMALIGRQMLIAALILFLYSVAVSLAAMYFVF